MSDVAIDNFNNDAQKRLSEGFNSLIVIAAPKVVCRLMEYYHFLQIKNAELPRDSKQWGEKHDRLLLVLVKEIRNDIYGKEKWADVLLSQVHLVRNNPKSRSN